jgi:hypothetical protein
VIDTCTCGWCFDEPAVTIVYATPTGASCAQSRQARIDGYARHMRRAGARRKKL